MPFVVGLLYNGDISCHPKSLLVKEGVGMLQRQS